MNRWACAFLVACAVLPFLPVRNAPHVHDDQFLRDAGSLVADPDADLGLLWRADVFGTPDRPTGQSGFWRPAVLLGFRLEHVLTGGVPHPYAWLGHMVNVLLHALATCALWRVLDRLGFGLAASTLAATVFAVHPVHAESVAWISGRSDVGATACAWAGTALLLRPRPGRVADLAGAGLLLAGLLFKESALLLVLLAAALRLLVREASDGRSLRARRVDALLWPGLALAAYLLLRGLSFTRGVAPEAYTGPEAWDARWWTWLSIVPEFVRLLLWPGPASPLHPVAELASWRVPPVLVGAAVLAVLCLLVLAAWRRRDAGGCFGFALCAGTLLMLAPWVPGLRFPTGYPEVAAPLYERYAYAAAAAPGVLLAWWGRVLLAARPSLAAGLALLVAFGFGVRTERASRVWSSDEAFARAGLRAAPASADLANHLGVALLESFRSAGSTADGEQALAAFESALQRDPGHELAALNRFITLVLLGREDDATLASDRLLRTRGEDPMVLVNLARWHAGRARWDRAIELVERALDTGAAPPDAAELLQAVLAAREQARADGAEGGT